MIYTSVYILVQNILMWTHGQKLMGGAQQFDWKKIVTTPAIAAILAGLRCSSPAAPAGASGHRHGGAGQLHGTPEHAGDRDLVF